MSLTVSEDSARETEDENEKEDEAEYEKASKLFKKARDLAHQARTRAESEDSENDD